MSSTFDTVANIISETCDIEREKITPESHAIDDLGIDSLDFLDVAFAIDKAFGIKLPLEQWTQEVNDGKATTEQYFVMKNLCARIDELSIDANPVAGTLHTPFQEMSYAKLLPDFARISRAAALVKIRGSAADDFQGRDLCQVGEDFVLHAGGEEGVLGVAAEIFKRQHGDAFIRDPVGCCRNGELGGALAG